MYILTKHRRYEPRKTLILPKEHIPFYDFISIYFTFVLHQYTVEPRFTTASLNVKFGIRPSNSIPKCAQNPQCDYSNFAPRGHKIYGVKTPTLRLETVFPIHTSTNSQTTILHSTYLVDASLELLQLIKINTFNELR